MSTEENKRIVAEGLERRKADRVAAEREAELDNYEQEQIRFCNLNCADARMKRQAEQATRRTIEEAAARRAVRAAEAARAQAMEDKAVAAVRYYALVCLVILLVSALTQLPFWAAATLILGGAVFPAAYIFRLYNPIGEAK